MNKDMKVLICDIETSPNIGYAWGKWEQNIIENVQDWFIMSFAYKWLGDKTSKVIKLNDFKSYSKDKTNDKNLLLEIHKILNEADVVVAHNGMSFDVKKINARLIFHDIKPPSPFKVIDTKLIAKRHFKFDSNSLNDLCKYFKIGEKVDTGGFELWLACMAGSPSAWRLMAKYNKHDVDILEKLYITMLPWMSHPNRNLFQGTSHSCPNCGSSKCQRRGTEITSTTIYQRWQCQDCGKWSKSTMKENSVNR